LEDALKWVYRTGGNITSSPALGDDGTLYVGVAEQNMAGIAAGMATCGKIRPLFSIYWRVILKEYHTKT
jgi:transketolase